MASYEDVEAARQELVTKVWLAETAIEDLRRAVEEARRVLGFERALPRVERVGDAPGPK